MTMILSEEQRLIRDTARAFARDKLAPDAAERDRNSAFPKEALEQMGELGLLGMLVPETWDGAGADHVAYALAIEEIAAGDGACSTIMSVHNSVACLPILRYGSDAQKDRFLKPMARGELLGAFALSEPQAGGEAVHHLGQIRGHRRYFRGHRPASGQEGDQRVHRTHGRPRIHGFPHRRQARSARLRYRAAFV
jgi:alkylation response protein AidB-like acyl-CoA dehydrogenase